MEFSQKEEATYDLLVNTKVGEIKQLKYEMCRPKKKGKAVAQKKEQEKVKPPAYATPKPRIQNYSLPRDHSEPLPLPLDNSEELYDVPYATLGSEEGHTKGQNIGHQLSSLTTNDPPPSSEIRVSETGAPRVLGEGGVAGVPKVASSPIPRRTLPPPRRLPTPHRKAPPPPSTQPPNDQNSPAASKNYEPWSWRQQNYESWTPLFKATSNNPVVVTTDVGPPPSIPPPRPPTQVPATSAPCASVPSLTPPCHVTPAAFTPAPSSAKTQPPSQSSTLSSSTPFQQPSLPLPPPSLPGQKSSVLTTTPTLIPLNPGVQQNVNPPALVQNPNNNLQQTSSSPTPSSTPSSTALASSSSSSMQQPNYEPWNWRRMLKEEEGEEEVYSGGLLPPAPAPVPLGGSIQLLTHPDDVQVAKVPVLEPVEIGKFGDARARSILKSGSPKEKKKKVRMLFPIDSMTNV